MIFPDRITSEWLAARSALSFCFHEVEELYEKEKYDEARALLNECASYKENNDNSSNITNLQVMVMYGWLLYRLRDFDEFQGFFSALSEIELANYPGLEIIRFYEMHQAGKNRELYDICTLRLEFFRSQIDHFYPDLLLVKCFAAFTLGEVQEAIMLGEASYSFFLLFDDQLGATLASNWLGLCNRALSDYRESLKWYERSLNYIKDRNWKRRESMVLINVGVTQYKLGRLEESLATLKKSLQIGIEKNLVFRQLYPNIALGNVFRLQRNYPLARKYLHTSLSQSQSLQFPREEALSLEFLGDIHRDEGEYAQARRFYTRTMAIAATIAPEGDLVMEGHRRIGECYNHEGNYSMAMSELEIALKMTKAQGDRYEEGVTLRIMAETYRNTFDNDNAVQAIKESISILRSIDASYELAVALLSGAEITFAELENPRSIIPKKLLVQKAWDHCTKALDLFIQINIPWWIEKSRVLVGKIVNTRASMDRAEHLGLQPPEKKSEETYTPGDAIIYSSSRMRDLLDLCDMYAVSDEPVLILGETGTGKELIARRLHRTSKVSKGELVTVNVAAIPEQMFEREFFGHIKGSFSGADRDGQGYAALAHNGTLFLDEIGDLPMDAQVKLLRLLEDGTYQALGDPTSRQANIRIIAATNANLPNLVAAGKFRADLYYRLRILELPVPALRNRPEDVLPLLRHFLSVAAKKPRDLTEYFNRSSLDLLEQYNWPGNVRDVSMLARRAHLELISRGKVNIEIERPNKTPLLMTGPGYMAMEANAHGASVPGISAKGNAVLAAPQVERSKIIMALEKAGGNRHEAAKTLGISRSTLYRKMDKFDIDA